MSMSSSDGVLPPSIRDPALLKNQIAQRTELCNSCRNVNIRDLILDGSSSVILGFATDVALRSTSCVLCSLATACVEKVIDHPDHVQWAKLSDPCIIILRGTHSKGYVERGYSTERIPLWPLRTSSLARLGGHVFLELYKPACLNLSIAAPRFIVQPRLDASGPFDNLGSGSVNSDSTRISLKTLQSMMLSASACWSHHSTCGRKVSSPNSAFVLRLIDVEDRTVRPRPRNSRYAALSYMWGKLTRQRQHVLISKSDPNDRQLPEDIPQTIEDVMRVAKLLGLRYIWVDFYCINQLDMVELQTAVVNMDTVYEGAFLTICPFWVDAEEGLHGVSRSFEDGGAQSLGTNYICSEWSGAHPLDRELKSTPWHTRAWIYQESLLSRQRLCFMPSSVLLLCRKQSRSSHFYLRSHNVGDGSLDFDRSDVSMRHCVQMQHWDFHAYNHLILGYSGRFLSQQTDALRAISGILERITKQTRTNFVQGIPRDDLINGLLWSCRTPQILNVPWEQRKRNLHVDLGRRADFPSWSWVAYNAQSEYKVWITFESKPLLSILSDRPGSRQPKAPPGVAHEISITKLASLSLQNPSRQSSRISMRSEDVIVHLNVGQNRLIDWRAHGVPGAMQIDGIPSLLTSILGSFHLDRKFANKLRVSEDVYRVRLILLAQIHSDERKTISSNNLSGFVLPPRFTGGLCDTVISMAVNELANGEIERLGIIAVPLSFWEVAQPEPCYFDLV